MECSGDHQRQYPGFPGFFYLTGDCLLFTWPDSDKSSNWASVPGIIHSEDVNNFVDNYFPKMDVRYLLANDQTQNQDTA